MERDQHRRLTRRHGLVESRMRWKSHVRFGGRAGETHPPKGRQGAPVRSHVANTALDECRRRVQNETLGHRGRKPDPLYRARRLFTMAAERLPDERRERLVGLLAAGDPKGEVKLTWHAKEVVRQIYDHTDPALADAWVDEIIRDFADRAMPLEVRRLGRTIKRWRDQIVAWHRSHVSNGPTEAVNNLIKRVKRVAFGMRRFRNYRIRALLYAGRPNWDLLDTLTPP